MGVFNALSCSKTRLDDLLQLLHIHLFSGITLAFHEMGHLLFAWAPHFVTALMGSVFQVAIPVIVVIVFYHLSRAIAPPHLREGTMIVVGEPGMYEVDDQPGEDRGQAT